MDSTPLVSIITPSYNQADFLEDTIKSVVEQDYPNIEYIIIDGGSTDGSQEIIKKYADQISFWISEPDQGQTDAINKGFSKAKGEIFAWINSDDTYLPDAINQAVDSLKTNPDIGMIYGDANLINEKNEVIGKFPARQTDYKRLRRGYVHIPQQASFFRSGLWKQVGPLDPTFYFAMDYDLWIRLAKISQLKYTPQLWANFRIHSTGKSVISDDRCWPEMLHVHFREGGSCFSWIYFKAKIRPLVYSWLPIKLRTQIRRML
jgi:glycosyltransferase involved in cell wall biosynthesis